MPELNALCTSNQIKRDVLMLYYHTILFIDVHIIYNRIRTIETTLKS